jgi:HD-GYP domain-containing protein (c-di-GMP phosphodiesterase class II)
MANPTSIIRKSEPAAVEALFSRASSGDLLFRAHALRVAALSVRIGRAFGFEGPELETLALAAKLHDVGKLAVPRSILAKPGPLDEDEWATMRRHPT